MNLYEIDARTLYTQDHDSAHPRENGVIYTSTKKVALKTARQIALEAKAFIKELNKWNESLDVTEDTVAVLNAFENQPEHPWASGSTGTIVVNRVTTKSLPTRTLAEAMLNNGDWKADSDLVWEKEVA